MTGEELKALRKRLQLSQDEVGLLCYVDGITVWRWEAGKTPVPELVAEKMVNLVACLPDELVKGETPCEP